MPIVAQYRFVRSDLGLLGILFPHVFVMKGPYFPEFVPGKRIIVVSEEKRFAKYPKKKVIQIISSASVALDTREGFLRVLRKKGVSITKYQHIRLHQLPDDEFWRIAKIAVFTGKFFGIPRDGRAEKGSTPLDLFRLLFKDFFAVYRIYWELRKTRSGEEIFGCIVAMMHKAKFLEKQDITSYYRSLLRENRRFLPLFQIALHHFMDTVEKTDDDWGILALFATCSAPMRTRGPFPYFKDSDCIGWKLQMMGYSGDADSLEATFRRRFPTLF